MFNATKHIAVIERHNRAHNVRQQDCNSNKQITQLFHARYLYFIFCVVLLLSLQPSKVRIE